MPSLVAGIRNSHGHCPPDVLTLIKDVIKYSDNEHNKVRHHQVAQLFGLLV